MINIVNYTIGMMNLENSNMKGVGIERRRCENCQNLQEITAIDGAKTIFFRCDRCNSETFINEKQPYDLILENFMIDST